MYVCVCATHDKPNTSLPSVKYVVISFTGSAAQHSFGFFFLGLFSCLCALDHMFDGIAGKVLCSNVVSSVAHMLWLLVLEQTLLQNVLHWL